MRVCYHIDKAAAITSIKRPTCDGSDVVTYMHPPDPRMLQLAEVIAHVAAASAGSAARELRYEEVHVLARAYVALRDQIRALHDLVDLTDPNDPIGAALTTVGLVPRPRDLTDRPRLVPSMEALSSDQLVTFYCTTMNEIREDFVKHETYIVRVWDGMDGCWSDCTAEITRDEALRYWAEKTASGTRHISYTEIDYYRVFPGGTRMLWNGDDGREMNR